MEDIEEKLRCPRCNSTQLTADKRGFNSGKAVAGAVLTGGIGLLAGLHGKDKIVVYCMACGEKWKPAEYAEKKRKAENNKKTQEDLAKLQEKQKERKTLQHKRYEFMQLYRKDKGAALEFAKLHSLPRHLTNDVEVIYSNFKNDIKKEVVSRFVGGVVIILVVALVIYMCSSD